LGFTPREGTRPVSAKAAERVRDDANLMVWQDQLNPLLNLEPAAF
jgi:hypothetical protein